MLERINKKVLEGKVEEIKCNCGSQLLQTEIKSLLGEEGFQNYLKAEMKDIMKDLIHCANENCNETFEKIKSEPKNYKEPIEELNEAIFF